LLSVITAIWPRTS